MKNFRHILFLFCALSTMSMPVFLAGCKETKASEDKPLLAVSIEPQRKMLQEIAGDQFEIVTMLARGANPETYDPTVTQKMKASKAKAYFEVGYLPFEKNITGDLPKDVLVVNTSDDIEPIMGTHSHGDEEHQEPDPHVWSSFQNAKLMAQKMTATLQTICPDSAEVYQARFNKMAAKIDSLNRRVASVISQAGMPAFAVWHPSLSYFARDYGLHQVTVGQESKEATIGNIASAIQEAKADSVRVFFYQREFDSRKAESISKEIGAQLVPISPLEYEWEKELINIANALAR